MDIHNVAFFAIVLTPFAGFAGWALFKAVRSKLAPSEATDAPQGPTQHLAAKRRAKKRGLAAQVEAKAIHAKAMVEALEALAVEQAYEREELSKAMAIA